MQFSFCLEMLYTNLLFEQRLEAASADGIRAIEIWDWRNKNLDQLQEQLATLDLQLSNMSGNRVHGMLDPVEQDPFLAELRESGQIAKRLGCPRLMLLAQPLLPDDSAKLLPSNLSQEERIAQAVNCGRAATKIADELQLDIVIEPLNSVLDHPNFFLDSSRLAFDLVRKVQHPRVKVLYDVYHMAAMKENIEQDLTQNIDLIGHFHIADLPGRQEPGTGTLDFKVLSSLLRSLSFEGTVGFEFKPGQEDSSAAVRRALEVFCA